MELAALLSAKGGGVEVIEPSATAATCAARLSQARIGALVVVQDSELVGIISERDLVEALATFGVAALELPVAKLMTTEVVTRGLTTKVDDLMALMTERRIRHVPVLEEGRLVGIVSIGDVVKSRIAELEHDRQNLLDYVGAR